MVEFYFLGNID